VEAASWPKARDLIKDFEHISGYVEDNVPAYLLVRLDTVASEWLAISYVPDTARVRDKVRLNVPIVPDRGTSFLMYYLLRCFMPVPKLPLRNPLAIRNSRIACMLLPRYFSLSPFISATLI
jgi:hypothetical protein